MRAFKIVPSMRVTSAKLSSEALRRLSWFDYWHTHQQNISLTCRHFGISRDTFYLWQKKFNPHNLQSLEDNKQTRTPHHLREMTTPPSILKRIYEIRLASPWMSKYEICEQLKREGIKISTKPIEKVIRRHNELKNTDHVRKVTRQRKYKIARIKAAKELKEKDLGSLVQIDTKYLYILGQRFFVFVAIDCKSRLGYTYAYKTCNSTNAADFLLKVIDYFPFKIQAINTDNGPEYLLNFHKLSEQLDIPHYFNHPHTPKMNARAERLIQTLEYEYLHYRDDLIPELEFVRSVCSQFNDYYNYQRYHRALDYKTPFEYVTNYQTIQKGNLYVI